MTEKYAKEAERTAQLIEMLEAKNRKGHEELTALREQHAKLTLAHEVLLQEQAATKDAAAKTEARVAELEGELGKLRAEDAGLKDNLAKLQALNEGLGQDKVELSKQIVQNETEKLMLSNEKSALIQEKSSMRFLLFFLPFISCCFH